MMFLTATLLTPLLLSPQEESGPVLADVLDRIENKVFLADANLDTLHFAAAGSADDTLAEGEVELLSVDGPGVLGRLMMVRPAGNLRFYFDGADEAAIDMPARQFFSATGPFEAPLTILSRQRGICRAPIPFSTSLRVTTTQASPRFEAGVQRLPAGTEWPSADLVSLNANAKLIERVARDVASDATTDRWRTTFMTGQCDKQFDFEYEVVGNGIVHWFRIEFIDANPIEAEEIAEYLRSMRFQVIQGFTVEGKERVLVDVPFGDFFGTAPDQVGWRSDAFAIDPSRRSYTCRLPMPYVDGIRFKLDNVREMPRPVRLKMTIGFEQILEVPEYRLRAGYFRHQDRSPAEHPEVRLAELTGPGRLVGLSLSGRSLGKDSWDEGAVQVMADGQALSSGALLLDEWFDRITRRDGPGAYGYSSRNRYFTHDPIGFDDRLSVDLSVSSREASELDLEGVVYWYGADDAPMPQAFPEDGATLVPAAVPTYPFDLVAGTIEAENLLLDRVFGEGKMEPIGAEVFAGTQLGALQWTGYAKNDFGKLVVPVRGGTNWTLGARFWCYPGGPKLKLSISGRPIGGTLDLNAEQAGWRDFPLGDQVLQAREHTLLVGVIDAGSGEGPGVVFDYLSLLPRTGQ